MAVSKCIRGSNLSFRHSSGSENRCIIIQQCYAHSAAAAADDDDDDDDDVFFLVLPTCPFWRFLLFHPIVRTLRRHSKIVWDCSQGTVEREMVDQKVLAAVMFCRS